MEEQSNLQMLLEALTSDDEGVRIQAIQSLTKLKNKEAIFPIVQVYKEHLENNHTVKNRRFEQCYTCEVFWNSLSSFEEEVVPYLVEVITKETDIRLLEPIAVLLGILRDNRAVEALVSLLKNTDGDLRMCAAEALGDIGDNRAVEPLIELLKDASLEVQHKTIVALGDIDDRRALPALEHIQETSLDEVYGYNISDIATEALNLIRQN